MAVATDHHIRSARKIAVLGVTGAGKSTAARAIADRIDAVPIDYDDNIRWLPAAESPWTPRTDAEQRRIAGELISGDAWVIASLGSAARALVVPEVDLLIHLDYSPVLTFSRLLRRTVRRCVTGEPACNGNRETVGMLFGDDSILKWWKESWRSRRQVAAAHVSDPSKPPTVAVRAPRELDELIGRLGR